MHRFLARFSEPVSSVHRPSWADFITATPAFKLSVHTGGRAGTDIPRFYELDELYILPYLGQGELNYGRSKNRIAAAIRTTGSWWQVDFDNDLDDGPGDRRAQEGR